MLNLFFKVTRYNDYLKMKLLFIHIFFLTGLCNVNEMCSQSFVNQNDEYAMAECIIEHSKNLLGRKYEANTLNIYDYESLTYFKDKFDCVTFVEYVLAMSLSQVKGNQSFEFYLQQLRYRNGLIEGYGSRLHYFAEWIIQNQQNGWIKDVTKELGGIKRNKKIDFMSKNKSKYPLISSTSELEKIKLAEKIVNQNTFYFIPMKDLEKAITGIREGDIIAITTFKEGLDFVHTGIAAKVKGKIHLLHASEDEGQVLICKLSLVDYLLSNKKQSGIVVLRAQ